MTHLLCVDIGSTFTKAALVEETGGVLVARASVATTAGSDVLDGVRAARADLAVQAGAGVPEIEDRDRVLICSSAGGGLRLAVVGYEREITAEAGGRVGLSAGAKVVHVVGGALDGAAVAALRAVRPDVVLLVGGTDGGNAECIRHNAERLGRARLRAPVVVAGNRAVQDEVAGILTGAGRRHVLTDNVLPRIGEIAPVAARRAIREVFLRHVIGGKGLSRGPLFAALVRAATPDAVLDGVQVVAGVAGADVMVLDVGGATTDAYSVLTPQGEDATLRKHVVAPIWAARTVEADLGMRWGALGLLAAARREGLPGADSPTLEDWVQSVTADPGRLPADEAERRLDLRLAGFACVIAARRHGRPAAPGEQPRPLADVAHLVGSGGALRHGAAAAALEALATVTADHAGGWRPPTGARGTIDTAYLLGAIGLLAPDHPGPARALAARLGHPDRSAR
ncbi:MAG: glutamate mutase L [Ornithinimicrobium sp.]|uniref:glutamate mutase L n=1 Tax=Ornithinimicrobium sp. TaxID=1977084 RepID=UPI003D9BED16